MKINIGISFAIFLCFVQSSFAQPKDLSVAAFKRFESKVEEKVDKILEEEFKSKEDEIKTVSTPYEKGQQVTITIIQGERTRQVTGTFAGLEGMYAEIDERRFLLSDIADVDRTRLQFAGNVQLLQVKINAMRKKLEEDKSKRKEILIDLEYKEAGYTPEFFKSTAKLAGKFWTLDALGDKKVKLRIIHKEGEEFLDVQLATTAKMPPVFLVSGSDAIYASSDPENFGGNSNDGNWKSLSFQLLTNDFITEGSELSKLVENQFRLWAFDKNLGGWYYKAALDAAPETKEKTTQSQFTFHLIKSSVKGYERSYKKQHDALIESAVAYQKTVRDRLGQIQSALQAEQAARERELQERAARIRELEEAKQARENMIKELEQHYEWLTAEKNYGR